EQPPAHGGERAIENLEQRGTLRTGAQRLDQLKVAARHLIEGKDVAAAHERRAREVRKPAWLELPGVAQQRTSGANRRAVFRRDSQPIERREPERAHQVLAREIRVELPRLTL